MEVPSQNEHTIRVTLSTSLQFLKDHSTRYLQAASQMIADSLSTRDVLISLIIMLLLVTAWHLQQSSNLPSNTPWVGGFRPPFSKAVAPYMSLMHGRAWLEEVCYEVYWYYSYNTPRLTFSPVRQQKPTMRPPRAIRKPSRSAPIADTVVN